MFRNSIARISREMLRQSKVRNMTGSVVLNNQKIARKFSTSINVNQQVSPVVQSIFAKSMNLFKSWSNSLFQNVDEGIDVSYHGPSYRFVNFSSIDQLKRYINNGGLTRNKPHDKKTINYSVKAYIETNEPSPWFGGSSSLSGLHYFIKKDKKNLSGYIILIDALPAHETTLAKESANLSYLDETGELNPQSSEQEVLHRNGDFVKYVTGAIRLEDLDKAISGHEVENVLTGEMFHPKRWDDEQSAVGKQIVQSKKANHVLICN